MSRKNGDRARHDRQRKSKMHNRSRIRLLKASLAAVASADKPAVASAEKPKKTRTA